MEIVTCMLHLQCLIREVQAAIFYTLIFTIKGQDICKPTEFGSWFTVVTPDTREGPAWALDSCHFPIDSMDNTTHLWYKDMV